MVVSSLALAHSDASLIIFPDYGAWRGASKVQQEVGFASLVTTSAQLQDENAEIETERQPKAELEALGIVID